MLSSLLCFFVSCDKNDEETIAPSGLEAPVLNIPDENALCIDNTVAFAWFSTTTMDENTISYTFQYATDIGFTTNLLELSVTATALTVQLEKDKVYYWRVKAMDALGNESPYSTTRQLQTEGTASSNNLPYAPELIAPLQGAIVSQNSLVLQWQAADSNSEDTLSYDLFFGTDNPPSQKILSAATQTSVSVNTTANRDYFWYVISHDDQGGSAKGQVWSFSRE